MKKLFAILIFQIGFFTNSNLHSQVLNAAPAIPNAVNPVVKPIGATQTGVYFSNPNILSVDLNDSGEKILKLQQISDSTSLILTDLNSEKILQIKNNNLSNAKEVFFINDKLIALEIQGETSSIEIIEIGSSKVIATLNSNQYIGSTESSAYFCIQNSSKATIEKFDISTKKQSVVGTISGEIFGWYFSKLKGIVGVAIHSNMTSKICSVENGKLGKSLFEFSSGYYFETKGCNSAGDVFYGITNFQSLTTYACAISKTGIKPIKNKTGESCTDIFIIGNDLALSTNNINTSEYQESQNTSIQKILNFARETHKGSSIQLIDFIEEGNVVLFCVQGEITIPKYFVWKNNNAIPVATDKFETKNLNFSSSKVVKIQVGNITPQTGRIYLPSKKEKSSPLVIYIPKNIFLPYSNQFNPIVQNLCQRGYAVFVWNTRFSLRPKTGFSYSDLQASFPKDIEFVINSLSKEYQTNPGKTFLVSEGLGAYLALNVCATDIDSFSGITISRLDYPGKENSQDLTAARLFGEDARLKYTPLDQLKISKKCNYLVYSSFNSSQEARLQDFVKENKFNWTINPTNTNGAVTFSSTEVDYISNWIQHLSRMGKREVEDKSKVDVKTK